MDFDPTEIRRMMEKRQRELRGNRSAPEDALSPTKRLRQEKENEATGTSSPQKQGFMAKFAVSPKNPRRDHTGALSQASPSTRARLNEVSKRYAELEDELPKRSCSPGAPTTPKKKTAPPPPTIPKDQNQKRRAPSPPNSTTEEAMDTGEIRRKWEITERIAVVTSRNEQNRPTAESSKVSLSTKSIDPSEVNVAEKAKQFDKPDQSSQEPKSSTIPKSKVVPRGKIADKISKFDVGSSGPRCEIDSKPMASVSARAKFFEKAMEADKKAADAVYVPVSQRTAKYIEQQAKQALHEKVLVVPTKPVVCNTVVSPRKPKIPSADQSSPEKDSEEPSQYEDEASESFGEEMVEPPLVEPQRLRECTPEEEPKPKKVGTISTKLKNRLQDLLENDPHAPIDETLLSISEKTEVAPSGHLDRIEDEGEEELSEIRPEDELLMSPRIVKKSDRFMDDDTISRITGIPEDGHSTPKPCASSDENLGTPLRKTMSQYRRDEKEALEREANVKRIVYQVPSNMMQEIRKGKEAVVDEEQAVEALESYKRQMEEEMVKQESIMKQTSHALVVCQENGDKGSEQQVEAERLLLIATQRHHVAQSELQRINVHRSVPQSGGTMTICDIKLPYKNEFLKLMRQCNDVLESTHYFIVLVRSGASLLHTELVSTDEKILGGSVSLNHHMVLKNLQEGFRVFVDVYAVQALNRNHPEYEATIKKIRREKEKESNKGGGLLSAFTPSKKKNQGTPHVEEVKIRKPSFGLIGRVTLDESLIALDKQVHYLDNYFNESPLDGRIYMKIQLNMPPKVSHCGMLRLKDSNGFMSSYFAAIEGSHLNLWEDMRAAEEEQKPRRSFDLSQAVNTVRVEQSFSFYYFPLKLSGGLELQFLTYAEDESNLWADKLNACITRYSK